MNFGKLRSYFLSVILSITSLTISAQTVTDSIEIHANEPDKPAKSNIVQKVIAYFESSNKEAVTKRPKFSFIGGPHYSSDTKFGIGLLAAGLYSTAPADTTLKPSNVTLFGDFTTGKFFKIGVEGLHLYRKDTRRINYELSFNSYSTYYWGVGVDNALYDKNKTKYLLLNISLKANHLWKVCNGVYAGPLLKYDYTTAHNIKNAERWEGQPHKASELAVGANLQFDSRDNYTSPAKGWLGDVAFCYNQGVSSTFDSYFLSFEFNVCNYAPIWRNGVLASRLHGNLTFGDTPWCYMPTLGAAGTMRGYYEGQYRDKREIDITVELRQHLFRRCGIVAWGGVGAIFPSIRHFHSQHFLPSYGVGYRWEFKKRTNVRVDVGFGKKCWGVEFNIGEAF